MSLEPTGRIIAPADHFELRMTIHGFEVVQSIPLNDLGLPSAQFAQRWLQPAMARLKTRLQEGR